MFVFAIGCCSRSYRGACYSSHHLETHLNRWSPPSPRPNQESSKWVQSLQIYFSSACWACFSAQVLHNNMLAVTFFTMCNIQQVSESVSDTFDTWKMCHIEQMSGSVCDTFDTCKMCHAKQMSSGGENAEVLSVTHLTLVKCVIQSRCRAGERMRRCWVWHIWHL